MFPDSMMTPREKPPQTSNELFLAQFGYRICIQRSPPQEVLIERKSFVVRRWWTRT